MGFWWFKKAGINSFKIAKLLRKIEEEKAPEKSLKKKKAPKREKAETAQKKTIKIFPKHQN